jgi:RNA-directed DNA polymerase
VTELPPHLYVELGLERGHRRDAVIHASAHRDKLVARGVVPILSLGHLAHLTGVSYSYLREIVERRRDPYVEITRPKNDGGRRIISSPEPPLMEVQRWILHRILTLARSHPSSYAYQTGRSIIDCARAHLGARWLVKMDLHDYFDTVEETRVYGIFRALGYAPLVSLELARICTRLPFGRYVRRHRSRTYSSIPSYDIYADGWLPQGAPTSGALANAATFKLDHKLARVSSQYSLIYTRYSDDLVFSGSAAFDRVAAARFIDHVRNIVSDEKFIVHDKKTRIVPPGARHVVLGLLLTPGKIRLLPEFKRRINVHIRGVDRFGLAQHVTHRGFRSIFSFVNYVDGCLAFAQGVEPVYAQHCIEQWNVALAKSSFPVDAN